MTYKPNTDKQFATEHAFKRLSSTEYLARRILRPETLTGGFNNAKVRRCYSAIARMRMITDPTYAQWVAEYVRKR